jgi:excisionase family DNA binding protein
VPVKRRILKPTANVQQDEVATTPRLLTIKTTAIYFSCSVWAIRNLIWKREIPHLKIGKRFLLDRTDLDLYVAKHKIGAI